MLDAYCRLWSCGSHGRFGGPRWSRGAEVDHGARWARIPVIAAILEHGGHGIRRAGWQEPEILGRWRRFLDRPDSYLNPLLD